MGMSVHAQLTKERKLFIHELEQLLNSFSELDPKLLSSFERWQTNVQRLLMTSFTEPAISQQFVAKTKVIAHKFSEIENQKNIQQAMEQAKCFLEDLVIAVNDGVYGHPAKRENVIDTNTACIIVRRILKNFYKHLEAMYQAPLHGNGKIKKEDLERIQIGNEYDVQRILYSLIRPIFPETRLEAVDDAGYGSVRYDIVIEKYGIIIEVKCTRPSMTERKLTEELGADGFHYKGEYLFMFVYDKVKLISNIDAFEIAYTKSKEIAGKAIETVVVQEIKL